MNGILTNATCGNGVLVVAMPKMARGERGGGERILVDRLWPRDSPGGRRRWTGG